MIPWARGFQKWQGLIEELRLADFDGGLAVIPDIASLTNPEDLRVYRNLLDEFAKTYYGRSSFPIPGVTANQVKAKLNQLREWHGAVPPHCWAVTAGRELVDATSSWRELAEDTKRYLAEIDLLDPEMIFRDHVIEIDGANASGKSNLLMAVSYFNFAVTLSWNPESIVLPLTEPFTMDPETSKETNFFELRLLANGRCTAMFLWFFLK